MKWVDNLSGSVVGLDTAPLIYFTEVNTAYTFLVDPFFAAMKETKFFAVTSIVTLAEALVGPIKSGNTVLAQTYRDSLFNNNYITTLYLNEVIAEETARLRAVYSFRTPDAIQLAAAIMSDASFFLTNDKKLTVVKELKVLVLDDLALQQ